MTSQPPDPSTGPLRSVVFAGGGTAGHVSPLVATADALRRRVPDVHILCLGTAVGLEATLIPARGYDFAVIPKVPLPRKPSADLLRLPATLTAAVRTATAAIHTAQADVVVGFGGYVSTPAYLAARRLKVPIVIHEQNARAGLANRVGARLSTHVGTAFAGTVLPHAVKVGMPLRREIVQLDRGRSRAEALATFGLRADRPTILVTGGSLGAARLNGAFADRAAAITRAGIQVLHVTGLGKEFEPVLDPESDARYVVLPYADRMDLAYAVADLVVARSGASTVCELTAVGLPAVYVPLPIGNGEQRLNAAEVVEAGGGLLVDDADLTPAWIEAHVVSLVTDRARLATMAQAAAGVGERNADELMVDMILAAAGETPS